MGAGRDEIEAVYRHDFERFLRVAITIVGDEEAAYDAVQEAFARALRYRRSYSRVGSLEGWLWRTVVNTARTRRPDAVWLPEATTNGEPVGEGAALRSLIAALPERQRLALFLRYYADLDYEAIAEAMGISPGTVAATLNSARANLH
jgi:DNA-directed RNA polymerase specialized sigma24 family protein